MKSEDLCDFFLHGSFLWRGTVRPPGQTAERPPLVDCPRLLTEYIRSYSPQVEAVSSKHAMPSGPTYYGICLTVTNYM